ncbi:FAD dependent oxidoreductase [Rhypophila decipiens]
MTEESYIIVGAGVFGASTALHLIDKYPSASITLIDRNAKCGASWDWNKVIRSDYRDELYTRLALEARELWVSDALYNPYYHAVPMVWISGTEPSVYVENHRKAGVEPNFKMLTVDEAKSEFGGLFKDADYEGVDKIYVNYDSGWAEAKDVLDNVVAAAVSKGVKSIACGVSTVVFDESGSRAIGVQTSAGDFISGTKVILCNGAGLPKLMADSAPDRDDLQPGPNITAASVITGNASSGSDVSKLMGSPICSKGTGLQGGYIPPTVHTPLKFWSDMTYKNTVQHPSGRTMSMPPAGEDNNQWAVPEAMSRELEEAAIGILGPDSGITLCDFRVCWELTTASEDNIISPHPACKDLYIATAGSFHSFKFLPILGKYVVKMLDGALDPDLTTRWAWDQPVFSNGDRERYPTRELKEF